MSARYYLHRRADTGREKTLRLIVSRGGRKIPVSTTMKVKASQWSQKMQGVKAGTPGRTETNAALDALRAEANALALRYPDDDDLKAALMERMGTAPQEVEMTLMQHYDQFLDFKGSRVKEGTMKGFRVLQTHLTGYLGDRRDMKPSGVESGFIEDLQGYLLSAGIANNTVNKHVSRLKTFLTWLHERGHLDTVPRVTPLPTAQSHVVRLTLDELAALRAADLSREQPGYKKARDLFLVQVYTGQRFGDVSKMKWSDLDGDKWHLAEEKTGVVHMVPLAAPALAIIEKYRGTSRPLPRVSMQKVNDMLKEIGKLAGINAPVTLREAVGGEIVTRTAPKHEVLSTHVGRKTFISLMMEAGLSSKDLLGLTHSDLRSLKHYAGASEDHVVKAMRAVFGDAESTMRRVV